MCDVGSLLLVRGESCGERHCASHATGRSPPYLSREELFECQTDSTSGEGRDPFPSIERAAKYHRTCCSANSPVTTSRKGTEKFSNPHPICLELYSENRFTAFLSLCKSYWPFFSAITTFGSKYGQTPACASLIFGRRRQRKT